MARKAVAKNISYDDEKKRYYVTFDYGKDENGKRIKPTKTFKSKKEATQALKEFEADKTKGTWVLPVDYTVKAWLEYWLNDIITPTREKTTVNGYTNIINNHLIPALGNIQLQKLTPQQITHYYFVMSTEKKLSQTTIRKHHDLLGQALNVAVKQDVIVKNPIDKVEPPKKQPKEIKYLKPDEEKRLLSIVRGDRLEIVVYLGLYLGLRREEMCGLKWKHIDFENRILDIIEVRTAAGKEIVVKQPKSKNSRRSFYIVDELLDALVRERDKQAENKKFFGTAYSDGDYVVAQTDGKPYRPNYLSEIFKKYIVKNHFTEIGLHGLRHTFATTANAAGTSLYDISKMMGHSTPAITAVIYTHVIDPKHEEELKKIAESVKE